MLTLVLVFAGVAALSVAMWLLARRDLRDARQEAAESHARARLAEGQASAVRSTQSQDRDRAEVAEAQARIANVESRMLRLDLARAYADRDALTDQLEKLGAHRSEEMLRSLIDRLGLYGSGARVRNRKDG